MGSVQESDSVLPSPTTTVIDGWPQDDGSMSPLPVGVRSIDLYRQAVVQRTEVLSLATQGLQQVLFLLRSDQTSWPVVSVEAVGPVSVPDDGHVPVQEADFDYDGNDDDRE